MLSKCVLLIVIAFACVAFAIAQNLQTVAQWKQMALGFPSERDRQYAIRSGNFKVENCVPIDVDVGRKDGRFFVTIPRFLDGIPYTLAMVDLDGMQSANGPYVYPYPSYSWHNNYNNSCPMSIVSAFRVAMTECNQMWVIDSGRIGTTQVCPPKLLLFDLYTDRLVHGYEFDSSVYMPGASLLITPILDVRDTRNNCLNTMIYIADVQFHGLVIYDFKNNRAWRAESQWMYPDPDYGMHTIAGESFTLMDGIFGMSTDKRNLYFHPLASLGEYSVPLSVLNNPSNFAMSPDAMESSFRRLGSRKSECAMEAIDSVGNIYCVTFNPIQLISWNVNSNDYSSRNIIEVPADTSLLQFVSGMKVARNNNGKEELLMMSNRYQKIAAGTLNPQEINFRILRRPLNDMQGLNNKLIFP